MSKNVVFGIDIGGTSIKSGLFTGTGKLLRKDEIPTVKEMGGAYILDDIRDYIFKVLKDENLELSELAGIGMGVPGSVRDDGTVNKCVNLGWGVFNVADAMAERLGIDREKICIGNDANVAALGEYWQGSGKGYASMFFVTVGTGVGGGLIIDDKPINGINGAAAEIGHLPIVDGLDWACSCGKTGCLEQIASATGIARLGGKSNAKEVFDAAKSGDAQAEAAVDKASMYLAKGLACVAGIVDPDCFIIGGGVSAAGEYFLEKIRKYYRMQVFHPSRETVIECAVLGNDAGMYGAARLVFNRISGGLE